MNISQVSFGANRKYNQELIPITEIDKLNQRAAMDRRFIPIGLTADEFMNSKPQRQNQRVQNIQQPEFRENETPTPCPHKKKVKNKGLKGFILGIATTLAVQAGAGVATAPKEKVVIPFDSNRTTISQIAEIYDIDEDVIKEYNNIDKDTDLSEVAAIEIPTKYDYIQEKIEKDKEKLYSSKLDDSERQEIETEITALSAKKQIQEEIAKAYTDGEYVYISINTPEENPEITEKYGQFGIKAEKFKEIFDIKDEAIRIYNPDDVTFTWKNKEYSNPESGQYKDYTDTVLKYGTTIKVPERAIKKKNIDLSQN